MARYAAVLTVFLQLGTANSAWVDSYVRDEVGETYPGWLKRKGRPLFRALGLKSESYGEIEFLDNKLVSDNANSRLLKKYFNYAYSEA